MAQEEETPASTPPSNNTAGSQSTESNDYLTYENSTYRIKISYPSTWKVVNVSNANDSRFIKIIAFDSPDENAGIGVWTDNSPGNETIDTFLAEDIQNYRQNPDYPNFTHLSPQIQKIQCLLALQDMSYYLVMLIITLRDYQRKLAQY
jgi:hypothetical protein